MPICLALTECTKKLVNKVELKHIEGKNNPADALTKAAEAASLEKLNSLLKCETTAKRRERKEEGGRKGIGVRTWAK